jgi:putative nucleotidyltransferase with HDIG domain
MKPNPAPGFKEYNEIPLPSRRQCLALMEAHGMLANIREHSFLVMEVAAFLGKRLTDAGFQLHLPLIVAGALLHDLGKTPCLGIGGNHAEWGARVLEELGYPEVAQIVREHVYLNPFHPDPRPLREVEVVNYADKRVLHTRVVTLEDRIADLQVRYGRTDEALRRIAALAMKTLALEEKIFTPLLLTPLELLQYFHLK